MEEYRKPRSLFFPLLLVVLGIFLLLTNLGTVEGTTWGIVGTYWPLIFVIGGLDGLYRRDGWVGPLAFIGLGTVLLLGNLHYLQWGSLELLLRLWPIILIAWGLDVAFGRHGSTWNTIVRVAVGLLLVGGIVWLTMTSPLGGALKTEKFSQPLDNATESVITFSVAAGDLTLSGGAENDILVSGTVGLPMNMTLNPSYSAPSNGVSHLNLEGGGVVIMPFGSSSAPWNLKLNSVIPIDLTTKMGVGNLVVDLSDVKTKDFTSQLGVGRTVLTLADGQSLNGNVTTAIGEIVIRVPKGSALVLHVDNGLVSTNMPAGYTRSEGLIRSPNSGGTQIELDLNLAIGSLVIEEIP